MPAYNADVVLDVIAAELDRRGRGAQTRLAEAVGVKVQTVNKWKSRQTCPEPDKWPAIDDHFELGDGYLRSVSGLGPGPGATSATEERFQALEKAVKAQQKVLRAIDRRLAEVERGSAL